MLLDIFCDLKMSEKQMKKEKREPFGTQYDYFFATLENYYIANLYGIERIKVELEKWDKEAQIFIVSELADRIDENGIMEFDRNEILLLIE